MNEEFHNLFPQGGPNTVAGQYFSGAIIRHGANRPGNCIPAMWSTSRRRSSTGTAQHRTAGLPMWRFLFLIPMLSGWSLWMKQNIQN